MIDFEVNFRKINEYLASFVAPQSEDGNDSRNLKPSNGHVSGSLLKDVHKPLAVVKTTLPQNKVDFRARLSTFKYSLWTCIDISPLLCASYGWYLKERHILKCITCKAILCSSLPQPNQCEAYVKFSKILKERLKTAHKDWCGWPTNPSPPEFCHPPRELSTHYLKNITDNISQLKSMDMSLPYIDSDMLFNKLELKKREVSLLFTRGENLRQVEVTAILIALCGWVFSGTDKLECDICLRKVGLWNFLSLKRGTEFLELEGKYRARRAKKAKKEAKREQKEKKLRMAENSRQAKLRADEEAVEERERVKAALEKVERFGNNCLNIEEVPEMNEEEERVLLGKEEGKGGEEEVEGSLVPTTDIGTQHDQQLESGKESSDGDGGDAASSSDAGSSNLLSNEEAAESSVSQPVNDGGTWEKSSMKSSPEDQNKKDSSPENEALDNDDLWLEAVGGYVGGPSPDGSPFSGGSSVESVEPYSPKEVTRKRGREDSDSSFSSSDEDSGGGAKPPKQQKVDEETEKSYEKILKEIEGKEETSQLQPVESSNEEEESSSDCEDDDNEKEDSLFEEMKSRVFDPIEQHRHWCGWVVDYSTLYFAEEHRKVPGFRILPPQFKVLLPESSPDTNLISSEKYATNIDGLRAIREILDSWSVPPNTSSDDDDDMEF